MDKVTKVRKPFQRGDDTVHDKLYSMVDALDNKDERIEELINELRAEREYRSVVVDDILHYLVKNRMTKFFRLDAKALKKEARDGTL